MKLENKVRVDPREPAAVAFLLQGSLCCSKTRGTSQIGFCQEVYFSSGVAFVINAVTLFLYKKVS